MHAHDAGSARPILGDRFAADLLDRVDQPPDLGVSLGGNTPLICTRAKLIDDAARAFLARHDEAVALHLGVRPRQPRPAPRPRPGRAVVRRRPGTRDRAAPAVLWTAIRLFVLVLGRRDAMVLSTYEKRG